MSLLFLESDVPSDGNSDDDQSNEDFDQDQEDGSEEDEEYDEGLVDIEFYRKVVSWFVLDDYVDDDSLIPGTDRFYFFSNLN